MAQLQIPVTLNLFQGPLCRKIINMVSQRNPCVYILASQPHGTLYIGVTANLENRLWQHRTGALPGFTSKFKVTQLVWFEMHGDMIAAISREKQLKNWRRQWKINLIEATNPHWADLAAMLGFAPLPPRGVNHGP